MKKNPPVIHDSALAYYSSWLGELSARYRASQIKASVAVNVELLKFYWSLGADISRIQEGQPWGNGFMQKLSSDLRTAISDAKCFSVKNLYYIRAFYELYSSKSIFPQLGGNLPKQLGTGHAPTLGLLICKTKDNVKAQWALESIGQPMGISEYHLSQIIPPEIQSDLPTIEEIEKGLANTKE